jgi:uncharacterized protein (TIGR00251 family)
LTTLKVKVVPGARRTEIAGRYDDGLKVRVAAPPEDGKANRALVEVLARELGVKDGAVRIVRGHSSAQKLVEIDELTIDEVWARLEL